MTTRLTEKKSPFSFQADVVAVGPGWAVLCKPFKVSVHNDPGRDLFTFVSRLAEESPEVLGQSRPCASVHAVHRLDTDTNGLVLFALDKMAARELGHQFESKRVQKRYSALLHGDLLPLEGVWEKPLAREAGGRSCIEGAGKRVACETFFKVVQKSLHYTQVVLQPKTGRKHS